MMNLYKPQKDLSNYRVCILSPCKSYEVAAKFAKCTANMIAYSWLQGLKIYQMGITERMVIDWARNDLARVVKDKIDEYTEEQYTHVLWLDDDHTFNPDLAVKLIDHDQDMVSALYYARTSPFYPVVYVKDPSEEWKHFPIIEPPNALMQVDAVGFGALMMKRDVLDRVPEPWFTLDWKCGEDIAFCVQAKKYGVKIFCDGTYKLGHIGAPPIITEKDFKAYKDQNPDEFKDKVRIAL